MLLPKRAAPLLPASVAYKFRCGSSMGYRHWRRGTNNQDDRDTGGSGYYIFGVVCDGISRNPQLEILRSEVGAALISNFTVARLTRALIVKPKRMKRTIHSVLYGVLDDVVDVARKMTGHRRLVSTLKRYFGATIRGFITGTKYTYLFGIGDGIEVIDDVVTNYAAPSGSEQDILIYLALNGRKRRMRDLRFTYRRIRNSTFRTLVIGTDGMLSWYPKRTTRELFDLVDGCGGCGDDAMHQVGYERSGQLEMKATGVFDDDWTFAGIERT